MAQARGFTRTTLRPEYQAYLERQWAPPETPGPEIGAGLQQLVQSYNQAYQQAKAANEQRYQQMLGASRQETTGLAEQARLGQTGLTEQARLGGERQRGELEQRYGEMLGVAEQTTGQRAADIRTAYGQQQATGMQRLARLGMGGTTIAPTMQMGVQREQQSALNRLADQMQQTKLGLMERQAGALGGVSREALQQQLGIGERGLQQQLGIGERGLAGRLGIMERRQDPYPDLSSLQSIITGVGSQYEGTRGLPTMIQALRGIRY